MTTLHDTREGWLRAAVSGLRPLFDTAGFPLPENVAITCGWPSTKALARKARRIGECWSPAASESKTAEIFISPTLAEPARIMVVTVHELCHAAVGTECGHKGMFVRAHNAMHLAGKPTASDAGPGFPAMVQPILDALGPYPHAPLNGTGPVRKQTTRLLKVSCGECGYIARVTAKWIDEAGAPLCPCNGEAMQPE